MEALKTQPKKISFGGKVGYGIGDMGCNLLSGAVGSFITMYYTDSVMMGAAFIGTMMLMTRFLDGISDILMGVIIDRTHTKIGKARPWVMISLLPLLLSVILLFNVPAGLADFPKKVYVTLTYIFNSVICYTAVNTSYSTLCTMLSPDPNERTGLSSVRMFFSSFASLLANSYTVAIMVSFGGGQRGFSAIAIVYSLIAFVCIAITCITCKEYHIETKEEYEAHEKVPMKKSVKVMFSNPYTIPLAMGFVFNWFILVVNGSSTVYFTRDVLGNIGLIAPLSLAGTIPSLIVLASGIVPGCVIKFGKKKTLLMGAIVQAIGYLIITLAPYNMTTVLVGTIVKGLALGFVTSLLFASTADVADYIDLKHKVNMAGMTNSIVSFGMKVGVGFGSAILGWMLAWGGYSAELANSGAAQNAKTILAERLCYGGIPLICAIGVVICALFLDADKKVNELRAAN